MKAETSGLGLLERILQCGLRGVGSETRLPHTWVLPERLPCDRMPCDRHGSHSGLLVAKEPCYI